MSDRERDRLRWERDQLFVALVEATENDLGSRIRAIEACLEWIKPRSLLLMVDLPPGGIGIVSALGEHDAKAKASDEE